MKMVKNYYCLNGRRISGEVISFGKLKRGFLYGDGVFETLRAEDYRIFRWDDHWKRLQKGADICGFEIAEEGENLRRKIETVLRKNGLDRAYIRISVWRKETESFDPGDESRSNVLALVKKHRAYPARFYREGIRCIVSKTYFKNEKSPLSCVKTFNYLESILARGEARKQGYDDNILLNTEGHLASATVSNLFFVKGKKIFTPSLDCGILPGITRKTVLEICARHGVNSEEGKFLPEDLESADEVFLTNTLMSIMPVREIRGVFRGKEFRLAGFLMKELKARESEG